MGNSQFELPPRPGWATGVFCRGYAENKGDVLAPLGRIRTYNPSVNSRTACSRLALQTPDLHAPNADYRVNWGDSGGTRVTGQMHRNGNCRRSCWMRRAAAKSTW